MKRHSYTVTSIGCGIYRVDGAGFQGTREAVEVWFARRPNAVAQWMPESSSVLL